MLFSRSGRELTVSDEYLAFLRYGVRRGRPNVSVPSRVDELTIS